MAASRGLRALAAVALVMSLGIESQYGAGAADRQVRINITNGGADRVNAFVDTPPSGFSSIHFNDSFYASAVQSPCLNPGWDLPEGSVTWSWITACGQQGANILLRRTFTIPARGVISGRFWLAVHGAGLAYLNGHQVAESIGNATLVDVTRVLRGNGTPNVLAILGAQTTDDAGAGIAYSLQLTLSGYDVDAYRRAHPQVKPPAAPTRAPNAPTAVAGAPTAAPLPTVGPNQGACAATTPPGLLPITTQQIADKPTSTGFVRKITTQHVFVATRLVDINRIGTAGDMPSIMVNGQPVRASAVATDDATGMEVLSFLPQPLGVLPIGQPHNQPVGDTAAVTGYSRNLTCLALYPARVQLYLKQSNGTRFAEVDQVPYGDGADGGVAYDASNNLLGVVAFDAGVVDNKGQIIPLLVPAQTALDAVDSLIDVLSGKAQATAAQHIVALVTNPDGSTGVARQDGPATPTPGTGPAATAVPPTPTATH